MRRAVAVGKLALTQGAESQGVSSSRLSIGVYWKSIY